MQSNMAKTSTSFKNGNSGKPPGAQNRTTKEAKELLEQILLGQLDNIKAALETVLANDPGRYLDSCNKLFTYVLPRKTDITSDGEKINITFTPHESKD